MSAHRSPTPRHPGPVGVLRRRTLLAGGAGLLALAAAACGRSADGATGEAVDSATGDPAATGFAYEDARGKSIQLDTVPSVVVAQSSAAAALWDAGFKVKGAYGELATTDGKLNYQAGNLDLDAITVIGKTYGEFSVEKYAGMAPELLIDLSFDPKSLWYVPADSAKKIEAIAPTLGIHMFDKNLLEIIGEFTDLAAALGADVDAPDVVSARSAFEASVAEVKAAVAAKPNLRVLALSRTADEAWIANAAQHPDLAYLATLGVTFVPHGGKPADYFTQVSNEQLEKYSGDLVFDDARDPAGQNEADAVPTWKALPAVEAGQVFDWKAAAPYSYAASAPIFDAFAAALQKSEPV
jgi:iron complex transport system substrate-binding protein